MIAVMEHIMLFLLLHMYSRESEMDDATHYRESFFEVMHEIED